MNKKDEVEYVFHFANEKLIVYTYNTSRSSLINE